MVKRIKETPNKKGVLETISSSPKVKNIAAGFSFMAALAAFPKDSNAAAPLEPTIQEQTNELKDIVQVGTTPDPLNYIGSGNSGRHFVLDNGKLLFGAGSSLVITDTTGTLSINLDTSNLPSGQNFRTYSSSPNAIYASFDNGLTGEKVILRYERSDIENATSTSNISGELLNNIDNNILTVVGVINLNGLVLDVCYLSTGDMMLSGYNSNNSLVAQTINNTHPTFIAIEEAWKSQGYALDQVILNNLGNPPNLQVLPKIGYTSTGIANWATPDGKTWAHEIGVTDMNVMKMPVGLTYDQNPTITNSENMFSVTTQAELPSGHTLKVVFENNVMTMDMMKDTVNQNQYNLVFTTEMSQQLGTEITAEIQEYDDQGSLLPANPVNNITFTIEMQDPGEDMGMSDMGMDADMDMGSDMDEMDAGTPDMDTMEPEEDMSPDMGQQPDAGYDSGTDMPDMDQQADMENQTPTNPGNKDDDPTCNTTPTKNPGGLPAKIIAMLAAVGLIRRKK